MSVSRPWAEPELVARGRLPMHAVPHLDRLALDGTWRFQLLHAPTDAVAPNGWGEAQVPGCWTMQDTWDVPHYTNVRMPFTHRPPEVPAENPTGVYERTFEVPAAWAGRRVVLHVGAAESVLIVALDGEEIGVSKDSHLAAEFDLTDRLGGAGAAGPANFLDVGGGASAERTEKAFRMVLADDNVKAMLVNIFAGINRCDWIAEGVVQAVRKIDMKVPLIVRLSGTNVEQGRKIIEESGLPIIMASTLAEAAEKAVQARNEVVARQA